MDSLLQGLPGMCAYIDNLLITGETEEEHLKNLNAVLARIQAAGVHLKLNKVPSCFQKLNILVITSLTEVYTQHQ